jgi:hypothetical protein
MTRTNPLIEGQFSLLTFLVSAVVVSAAAGLLIPRLNLLTVPVIVVYGTLAIGLFTIRSTRPVSIIAVVICVCDVGFIDWICVGSDFWMFEDFCALLSVGCGMSVALTVAVLFANREDIRRWPALHPKRYGDCPSCRTPLMDCWINGTWERGMSKEGRERWWK